MNTFESNDQMLRLSVKTFVKKKTIQLTKAVGIHLLKDQFC